MFQQKKKHVKEGGLLYWCFNRKKNTLREEVYYIVVPIEKKYVMEVYYIAVSIEKKHVKGGGLLYWCSNRRKYTLREEVYYIGVPIEKKTR